MTVGTVHRRDTVTRRPDLHSAEVRVHYMTCAQEPFTVHEHERIPA